jgi:RHS repeat-associated protein
MPFGGKRGEGTGITASNYLFTDQELDKESGLYNYDARLYDPIVGRFISADEVVPDWFNSQSLNRYAYCVNNPLIYTDPSGHSHSDVDDENNEVDDSEKQQEDKGLLEKAVDAIKDFFTCESCKDGYVTSQEVTNEALIKAAVVVGAAAAVVATIDEAKETQTPSETSEKTAAEIKEENIEKGIPESQLGPSGKPKIHVVKHSTLKKAKDAARARAGKSGTTVKHASPKMGKGHFHGLKQDGTKIRTHDEYPK